MRKVWDIHGGVHPPENKTQTNARPIATVPLPSELVIPLNQHIGGPCTPIIQVGDTVLKGDKIADAHGFISCAAHASTSGLVTAIEARPIPHASGLNALCVVIQPDGNDTWRARAPLGDWRQRSVEALLEKIRDAGIAGMGGAGFPSAVKMTPRADQHIETLIINGTECEPYITADDVLMRKHADDIIAGTEIIAHILNHPSTVLIGVEDNKPEAAKAMQTAAENAELNIEVVTFPTKYPSGGEKQLIQILTGKEVESGKLPADAGIVVHNVGTAQAVYRAVCHDEPLISRITTVVGESLGQQQNIQALIGTPIEHILRAHDFDEHDCARLIIGGPMMGFAMDSAAIPIIKTTNCILVPSRAELPEPEPAQACIRCGICAEACPASLLPQQLYWYSRAEDFDRLRSHNLNDCIECGACSFVCPSNIPLVQYYRASKGAIRQHDEEKRKAEHARQRFEFRKQRLEKAEAEKEAKRAARKKAAEEAKAHLAKNKPNASSSKVTAAKSEDAASSAAKNENDDNKAIAKLQRAISSAESRRERAQKALNSAQEEGSDTARIETLKARLLDAEQKVVDATHRLQNYQQESVETENNTKPNSPSVFDKVGTKDTQDAIAHVENNPVTRAKAKVSMSPADKLNRDIATIEKRLQVARQKLGEAETEQAHTVEALKSGVSKLEEKLTAAKIELAQSALENATNTKDHEEISAAERAIEKAKQRSQAMATMSETEKADAQRTSLQKRLDKARIRLQKAEADGDDNIDAFRAGVLKLETKLNDLTQNTE